MLQQDTFHRPATRSQRSDTAMAMALAALVAGHFSGEIRLAGVAAALLFVAMLAPALFDLPARIWFGFSRLAGGVASRIVLAAVFYLVLTPVALFLRHRGYDPLRLRRWRDGDGSVFINRRHTYSSKDLDKPY